MSKRARNVALKSSARGQAGRWSKADGIAVLDSIPAMVYYKDTNNRLVQVNKAFAEIMGLPKSKIEGRSCSEFWPDQAEQYWSDDLEVMRTGRAKRNIVEPVTTGMGFRWVQTDKIPYRDKSGRVIGVIGISFDITEHTRAEEAVRALSLVDELTQLANRRGFFTLAEHQLRIAKRAKTPLFLLYADVDGLKATNDRFGHTEGDRLLRDTARVLRSTFRDSDIVARIGGDEFVVMMIESDNTAPAKLLNRLQKQIQKGNARHSDRRLSVSIGFTEFDPKAPCSLEELVKRADAMMYEEKRRKKEQGKA